MKKSDKTKEKILNAAIKLVSTKGYYASSTKEIAEIAGVSEGSVFKYFKSKEELLTQIVLTAINQFKTITLTESFPALFQKNKMDANKSMVIAIIEERFKFFENNADLMKIIFQELLVNEVVRNMFVKEIWPHMTEYLDRVIKTDRQRGIIKDIDGEALIKMIIGIIVFHGILEPTLNINNDDEDKNEVKNILQIISHGIVEGGK